MAWSVVNHVGKTNINGAASIATTLGFTPTTGHKLIVFVTASTAKTTNPTLTCADNNSNALTEVISGGSWNNSQMKTDIFFYDVPATAPTSVTVTATGTLPDWSVVIQEVSGLIAGNTVAAAVDGTVKTLQGSASPTGTSGYVSAHTNEFLCSIFGDFGNSAVATQPSGWTLDSDSTNTSANADCCVGYTNSTGGTESDSWSYTTTGDQWATITCAFKLPAAGFIAPCATVVGQGEGMTPGANTGIATSPTIYQAGRRGSYY